MKPVKFDRDYLLQDTLWPGVSLLVAAIVMAIGIWFHDQQQQVYETHSANHEAIHDDYDQLVYRRRLLERYFRRYSEFQELGFIGRESRLDWIETIRLAATGLDLPNVTYSLEPQLEVIRPITSATSGADIQVFLSRLEIDLGLVHELDMLRFFERLEIEAPGLMKVDRCDMSLQGLQGQELVADTNIVASCSLMIFSVITSDIHAAETES